MKVYIKNTSDHDLIPIDVLHTTTIYHLKEMIDIYYFQDPTKYTLVYAGQILENEKTIANCSIKDESTIYIVVKSDVKIIELFVKYIFNKEFKLKIRVDFDATIDDLKFIIDGYFVNKMGIDELETENMILMLGFTELENHKKLSDYNVKHGTNLLLNFKMHSGFI